MPELNLAVILKYVRFVSLAISIILILRMLRTYRRVRSVSRKSCVIAIAFPIATLLVYSVIIGSSLPSIALSPLFAFGLALGVWQGRKTKVWVENGRPQAQNTIWFLVVWALSYTLMQVLVQLGNRLSLNIGIGTMLASTAIAVGSQGLILIRLSQSGLPVRRSAVRPMRQGAIVASSQGTKSAPAGLPGTRDGRSAGTGSPAAPGERLFCSSCGAKIVRGDRFCRSCRAVIR